MSKGEGFMRRRFVALLLVLSALGVVVMFAGIGGSASRVTSAQAGRLGIDDEMTDVQERILSGYAAYELGMNGNDHQSGAGSPTTYFPRGSGDCPNNQSS